MKPRLTLVPTGSGSVAVHHGITEDEQLQYRPRCKCKTCDGGGTSTICLAPDDFRCADCNGWGWTYEDRLTSWFPAVFRPARSGYFECKASAGVIGLRYFDVTRTDEHPFGRWFMGENRERKSAFGNTNASGHYWRGLLPDAYAALTGRAALTIIGGTDA
jgi:hypothetical protein